MNCYKAFLLMFCQYMLCDLHVFVHIQIPASAVEMPGSADVSGLNVQFGALDFGSESALPDFGQSENCNSEPIREAAVVPQSQSSLYSKPIRSVSGRNGHNEDKMVSLLSKLSLSTFSFSLSSGLNVLLIFLNLSTHDFQTSVLSFSFKTLHSAC